MAQHPQIIQTTPEARLFAFPPSSVPKTILPPFQESSLMHPFNIPQNIFDAALDPRTPATLAITYAITVKLLSKYNKSTGKKPWAISKTRPFFAFVVLHNIFLAVYSAWTCVGMFQAMKASVLSPSGPAGLAGTADSLCHLHGRPGLGNSAYYNETATSWVSASPDAGIVNGAPSASAGRIWSEGLGYYGWIFYMSKFYEVLDTFIILAKGKPSSLLQTYHHAGAMLCMWAGIRYMSAPIWLFVQFNSFIHALMVSNPISQQQNYPQFMFLKANAQSL